MSVHTSMIHHILHMHTDETSTSNHIIDKITASSVLVTCEHLRRKESDVWFCLENTYSTMLTSCISRRTFLEKRERGNRPHTEITIHFIRQCNIAAIEYLLWFLHALNILNNNPLYSQQSAASAYLAHLDVCIEGRYLYLLWFFRIC